MKNHHISSHRALKRCLAKYSENDALFYKEANKGKSATRLNGLAMEASRWMIKAERIMKTMNGSW